MMHSSLAFPVAVDKGSENPSALNLHVLSQNLYSQLICTDFPLKQHACSNKAETNKDAKPLHNDKEIDSHVLRTSDTV